MNRHIDSMNQQGEEGHNMNPNPPQMRELQPANIIIGLTIRAYRICVWILNGLIFAAQTIIYICVICIAAAVLYQYLPTMSIYQFNPLDSQITNSTNTLTEAITATTEPHNEQSAHYSRQTYDNDAVHKYVASLRELQKQNRLKESYNYILQNVYSKDDEEAVQRNVVRKRKFLVANEEEIPEMVSALAKTLVKKINKDDTKNRETLEDAAEDLNTMIELGAKKYGDETQVIGLNTNVAGTSTFLLSIFATKKVSPTEREVDILMIVEEWIVKDGYKINGACKDGDEMCWSDVRITEFLQYQLFHDYMPEIDSNAINTLENSTDCTQGDTISGPSYIVPQIDG